MKILSRNTFPYIVISAIILLQFLTGLWHIRDPFIDGTLHYNWNPAFWLINAKATNHIGIARSFFGVGMGYEDVPGQNPRPTSFYASHPQLIGPVSAFWTRMFGYDEWSPRVLALLIIAGAAFIFFLTFWEVYGWQFAASFSLLFVSLPLIVIYGKMFNNEPLVLFFLAVSLWGFVKMIHGNSRSGLLIFLIGLLGMTLSDWSGFVFGGLVVALLLFSSLRRTPNARRMLIFSLGIVLLGFSIFLLQSYLQRLALQIPSETGAASLREVATRSIDLWKYRSGQESPIPWSLWFLKELVFININYSLILAGTGIAGVFWAIIAARKRNFPLAKKAVVFFIAAVLGGQLFYLLFLKQATFVHLYYQYFFSLPIAFGTIWLIDRLAHLAKLEKKQKLFLLAGVILTVAASALYARHVYMRLIYSETWGDRSDLAIVTALGELPADAQIVVVDNESALEWWANPNIEYYAHRSVERYSLSQQVPFAPYQIVPFKIADPLTKIIASGKAYGTPVRVTSLRCSTHFCILKLER